MIHALRLVILVASNHLKRFNAISIKNCRKTDNFKSVFSYILEPVLTYSLLDVMGSGAAKVQGAILKDFQKSVEEQGFIVEDLSFGVPDVDPQTQKSIDDLIKAGQDNERAKLEAKAKKTEAEADANAKIARAEGEAKANKKIADSITENNLKYMEEQAHLKHGFVTVQGANGVIVDKDNQ